MRTLGLLGLLGGGGETVYLPTVSPGIVAVVAPLPRLAAVIGPPRIVAVIAPVAELVARIKGG